MTHHSRGLFYEGACPVLSLISIGLLYNTSNLRLTVTFYETGPILGILSTCMQLTPLLLLKIKLFKGKMQSPQPELVYPVILIYESHSNHVTTFLLLNC